MTVRLALINEDDRPRERLDRLGAASLTDAELVALVVRSGSSRGSAVDLAEELLAEHGGLTGVARADKDELGRAHAMGPAKASALIAAFEIGRRIAERPAAALVRVRGPADIAAVARPNLADSRREECLVVIVNRSHRVLRVQHLTLGTDARCLIDPRDVLRSVLGYRGTGFALVHSHPSGDVTPSPADLAATETLQRAAEAVGVKMLDHVIVAGTKWQSLTQ